MSAQPGRPQHATVPGTTHHAFGFSGPVVMDQAVAIQTRTRLSRESRLERRMLVIGGALLAGIIVAIVLAGALSDAKTSRAAAVEARATNARIQQQVEAAQREVAFAATDGFLGFAARSFGWGTPQERSFALRPGGPPPPSLVPLGQTQANHGPDAFGAVLDLLFER